MAMSRCAKLETFQMKELELEEIDIEIKRLEKSFPLDQTKISALEEQFERQSDELLRRQRQQLEAKDEQNHQLVATTQQLTQQLATKDNQLATMDQQLATRIQETQLMREQLQRLQLEMVRQQRIYGFDVNQLEAQLGVKQQDLVEMANMATRILDRLSEEQQNNQNLREALGLLVLLLLLLEYCTNLPVMRENGQGDLNRS